MRAQTVIEWAAIGLMSALVLLLASYWVIAPAVSWFNGERFDDESEVLAEAEKAWWAKRKETKAERGKRFAREAIEEVAAAEPTILGLGETGGDK